MDICKKQILKLTTFTNKTRKNMITLIYACDEANGIGRENSLPWSLKTDMKHFKKTTENNVVVMGRKTYESFGAKPLKNRLNIVLSRTEKYEDIFTQRINQSKTPYTQTWFYTLQNTELIDFIKNIEKEQNDKKIFIIGGAEIYKQAINCVDEIIQTKINDEFECDAFFEFDENKFELTSSESFTDFDTEIKFSINVFKRK